MQRFRDFTKEFAALQSRKDAHMKEGEAIAFHEAEIKMRIKYGIDTTSDIDYENEIRSLQGLNEGEKDRFFYTNAQIRAAKEAARTYSIGDENGADKVFPRRLIEFDRDYLYYLRVVEEERQARLRSPV